MKPSVLITLVLATAAATLSGAPHAPDGEQVYRNNCTRCHIAIHVFTPRRMATVVHHMQVRAMLTREEQAAVLRYLMETTDGKKQ